jgi:glutaredoxin-like protein
MPLLKEEDREHLKQLFASRLQNPVKIHFFTQHASPLAAPSHECQTCQAAGELLEELSSLSDKIAIQVHDLLTDAQEARDLGVDRIPALVYEGKNKGVLRFFGVPAGYEFAAVVEDLVDLSRGSTTLSQDTREQISGLQSPVHIKVLVTPT